MYGKILKKMQKKCKNVKKFNFFFWSEDHFFHYDRAQIGLIFKVLLYNLYNKNSDDILEQISKLEASHVWLLHKNWPFNQRSDFDLKPSPTVIIWLLETRFGEFRLAGQLFFFLWYSVTFTLGDERSKFPRCIFLKFFYFYLIS